MTKAKKESEDSGPLKLYRFFIDAWHELKKVQFPSREETIQVTMLVLAMMVLFAAFLGLADLVVGRMMRGILT